MEAEKIQVIRVDRDEEFNILFEIRETVFQDEQQVPEEIEVGDEHVSTHYLALFEGVPCGTARWRITPFGKVKLERFAVLKEYRGKGVGAALVKAVLREVPGGFTVYLNAQIEVVDFYKKLGFLPEGEIFEEANIQHQRMTKVATEEA